MRYIGYSLTLSFALGLGTLTVVAQQSNSLNDLDTSTLQQRAEGGDSQAQNALGNRYGLGQGVPKNLEQAFFWFSKAANQGLVTAETNLGTMYLFGQGTLRNCSPALSWIGKAAESGDVTAQSTFGWLYGIGYCTTENDAQALIWNRKAAAQRNDQAEYRLGYAYEFGKGVPQDLKEAHRWLRLAADQGNSDAQKELVKLDAPRKSPTQENLASLNAQWLAAYIQLLSFDIATLKSQTGALEVPAQYVLAQKFDLGQGVAKDPEQALFWYRKAADQGFALAEYSYSTKLGQGPHPDHVQEIAYLRKAAEQGDDQAEFFLARYYSSGYADIIPQSDAEALVWYRRLADQNRMGGRFQVGVAYELGKGVPRDMVEAHRWFQLAANDGDQDAKNELAKLDAPPPLAAPATPDARAVTQADAQARADAAAERKADIEEKINELNQDIDGLQEGVESKENDINQLSNCSGIGAAICEAGAAKLRRDINKDKSDIRNKRGEIAELRSEEGSAATAGTSDSSGSSDGAGGGSYSGPNSSQVQTLLSRAPTEWSCPASKTERPTGQLIEPSSLPCMRDKYVWAALLQAWGAECHARLNMESEAELNAQQMMQNLNAAKSLCSTRPAVSGGNSCSTMTIYSCSQ